MTLEGETVDALDCVRIFGLLSASSAFGLELTSALGTPAAGSMSPAGALPSPSSCCAKPGLACRSCNCSAVCACADPANALIAKNITRLRSVNVMILTLSGLTRVPHQKSHRGQRTGPRLGMPWAMWG